MYALYLREHVERSYCRHLILLTVHSRAGRLQEIAKVYQSIVRHHRNDQPSPPSSSREPRRPARNPLLLQAWTIRQYWVQRENRYDSIEYDHKQEMDGAWVEWWSCRRDQLSERHRPSQILNSALLGAKRIPWCSQQITVHQQALSQDLLELYEYLQQGPAEWGW